LGYTGQSADRAEAVDLTPYGQTSWCAQYINDDATTQPGPLIDDISIPEIGYSDDFETADDT
jgi:hypothetical protein